MKQLKILGRTIYCSHKSCLDEVVGLLAIVMGIASFLFQMHKTASTMDVQSFSIYALCLLAVSECLFVIQGLMKKSWTIAITRMASFIGALVYIYIWYKSRV